MLEKIENIARGSDFKHSSRPATHQNQVSRYLVTLQANVNDSFSLSPATAFISSIHWKLKKININKDKFAIVFEFDGFEFTTQFHQSEIISQKELEYDLKKEIENFAGKTIISFSITSSINDESLNKIEVRSNLPGLNDFAEKIFSSRSNNFLTGIDDSVANKIFYEFEEGLRKEFNYINSCLLNFAEKFLSMKINLTQNGKRNNSLSMKNLKLKNVAYDIHQ